MVTGHDNILWIIKHSWLIFYLHVCKFWHKSLLPTIFFLLILSLLYFLKMHYNEFFNINRIIAFSLTNFNCTLTVLCSFFIPFCFDVAFLWPHRKSRYSSSCYLVSFLVLLIKEFTSMSTELYFVTQWSISIISALLCLTRCLLLTITLHPPKRCSFDSFIPFCTSQSTLSHLVGPLVIFDAYILTIFLNINCTSGFSLVNFVLYYNCLLWHISVFLSSIPFSLFVSSIFFQ